MRVDQNEMTYILQIVEMYPTRVRKMLKDKNELLKMLKEANTQMSNYMANVELLMGQGTRRDVAEEMSRMILQPTYIPTNLEETEISPEEAQSLLDKIYRQTAPCLDNN